ncbi:MAG: adenine-specific methyltransferase EcoRI family protein, partial [Endomicrobium sp.]|nr:adenine-specific methyltransferase EcoRI family protein [Endomicrobium sp.]
MSTLNKHLHKAKTLKNDEFYTLISDIEKELKHYKACFKNKIIFCNCDDPHCDLRRQCNWNNTLFPPCQACDD